MATKNLIVSILVFFWSLGVPMNGRLLWFLHIPFPFMVRIVVPYSGFHDFPSWIWSPIIPSSHCLDFEVLLRFWDLSDSSELDLFLSLCHLWLNHHPIGVQTIRLWAWYYHSFLVRNWLFVKECLLWCLFCLVDVLWQSDTLASLESIMPVVDSDSGVFGNRWDSDDPWALWTFPELLLSNAMIPRMLSQSLASLYHRSSSFSPLGSLLLKRMLLVSRYCYLASVIRWWLLQSPMHWFPF